jgi:DnaJ-class molecular chaperone
MLTVRVTPHPYFTRNGNNLEVRLPLTLAEAALGAKVDIPTPHGVVAMKVPPNTSSGRRLRIKGQGVRPKGQDPGDLLAVVEVMLPPELTDAEREWIGQIGQRHTQDVRSDLKW